MPTEDELRPLRVLIADDEAPARMRLEDLLAREPGVEIVGMVSSATPSGVRRIVAPLAAAVHPVCEKLPSLTRCHSVMIDACGAWVPSKSTKGNPSAASIGSIRFPTPMLTRFRISVYIV